VAITLRLPVRHPLPPLHRPREIIRNSLRKKSTLFMVLFSLPVFSCSPDFSCLNLLFLRAKQEMAPPVIRSPPPPPPLPLSPLHATLVSLLNFQVCHFFFPDPISLFSATPFSRQVRSRTQIPPFFLQLPVSPPLLFLKSTS